MLMSNIASEAQSGGSIISFIFIILIWLVIAGLICFLIIKPIVSYFKTKQEYYQAKTEQLKKG